ncbi:MAG: hypothetical protein Q4A84_06450 [Neisseria sp.]|uniref:hypothetical protein n=1 Tax=Neisseria sp. TaxID=192066 RepID=UPI0026DDC6E5|nr:hypothetical protein [Neisseria sp.]MDO4641326.1 hypothetical protein [Neisseria sp.]
MKRILILFISLFALTAAFASELPEDNTTISFTGPSGQTSSYRIYGDHLEEDSAPYGLLVYLHGDGADEFDDAQSKTLQAYADIARKHNLLMIAPKTPDRGSLTWWKKESSPTYLSELLQEVYRRYPIDKSRIWLVGYSGGAETISYNLLTDHSNLFQGGGALLIGGGGFSNDTSFGLKPSSQLKQNFVLKWLIGEKDTDGQEEADPGFDALDAAKQAYRRYRNEGFSASLEIVPNVGHYNINREYGPATLDKLITNRGQ